MSTNQLTKTIRNTTATTTQLSKAFWLKQGESPSAVFRNALAIASPREITNAFVELQSLDFDKVPRKDWESYLQRLGHGQFGYLSRLQISDFAQKVRKELTLKTAQLDALVIRTMRFADPELMGKTIQLASHYTADYSKNECGHIHSQVIRNLEEAGFAAEALQLHSISKNTNQAMLCSLHVKMGQMQEAESIAVETLEPESQLEVLLGFAEVGNITKANKWFRLITAPSHRGLAYAALIRAYSQRKLPADAQNAYHMLRREGLPAYSPVYESLMLSQLNPTISFVNRWFYKKESHDTFTTSSGMYVAMIKAYIHNDDVVSAWRVLRDASEGLKTRRDGGKIHVSLDLVRPFFEILQGKHLDYLKDSLELAEFRPKVSAVILGRLMTCSMTETPTFKPTKQSAEFCLSLFNEFANDANPVSTISKPYQSNMAAIKAYAILDRTKDANSLFEAIVDDSHAYETQLYASLVSAYSLVKDGENLVRVYKDMLKNKLEPTVSIYEALLSMENLEPAMLQEIDAGIERNWIVGDQVKYPLVFQQDKLMNGGNVIKRLVDSK